MAYSVSRGANVAEPIIFYFDFASPYAYFALDRIEEIGRKAGRTVEWRPVLAWAVFKELGVPPPTEVAAKWTYMATDMRRSAEFFGVPYRHPKLPVSAHLAARLYHAVAVSDPALGRHLGRSLFDAFFRDGRDITDKVEVAAIAEEAGIDAARTADGMTGDEGRRLLAETVTRAVADGVIGSPFFIIDGERFFGADRLPQISWRLGHGSV